MTHEAPRHSVAFGLRESYHPGFFQTHPGAVLVNPAHDAFLVPAYSQDSELLGCGDQVGIFCRRIPDADDGKEMTALPIRGGSDWYPTGNRFYTGGDQTSADVGGLAYVVEPGIDLPRSVYIAGEDGKFTGRAFWHPDNDEIWLAYFSGGGKSFVRINPATDTLVGYVNGGAPFDFDYCAGNSNIYFTSGNALYKASSSGVVTLLFDQTAFETWWGYAPFSRFQLGPAIAVVETVNAVFFPMLWDYVNVFPSPYASGDYLVLMMLDLTTETVQAAHTYGASLSSQIISPVFMHYSPQFGRLILQHSQPFPSPSILASYDPTVFPTGAFPSPLALLGFNGVSQTDNMTAPKGCHCDNVDKLALSVRRVNGVNNVVFYDAADLG